MKRKIQNSKFKTCVSRFTLHASRKRFHVSRFTLHEKGFTLLESLVAIAIFTVGISTAMSVISSSLSVGTRTKDKIIASYLAQEGIEVVRSIRDNNWISSNNWLANITTCTTVGCTQSNRCVQWNSSGIGVGCTGSSIVFYPSLTPPQYLSTAGTAKFLRNITVQVIALDFAVPPQPKQIQITSAVSCGLNCDVSLSEYLYNWK